MYESFGTAVAVTDSGALLVGAKGLPDSGGVFSYLRVAPGTWIPDSPTILGNEVTSSSEVFGSAVAMDAAGLTAVIWDKSAHPNAINNGAAYVITRPAVGAMWSDPVAVVPVT